MVSEVPQLPACLSPVPRLFSGFTLSQSFAFADDKSLEIFQASGWEVVTRQQDMV